MSLAGSGFLGLYLIGAIEYLQSGFPDLFKRIAFAGSSAGAVIASALACHMPLESCRIAFLRAAAESQSSLVGPFHKSFSIQDHLRKGLESLPHDAHLRASGNLFVSVTRVRDLSNEIVSEWTSREDLIETILCSCFLPGFSGPHFPSLNGTFYMDGGFTNPQPIPLPRTLKISPFNNTAHICPQKTLLYRGKSFDYWENSSIFRYYRSVIPSPPHAMMAFYAEGYEDAKSYVEYMSLRKSKKII
ncbi:UNVERIFIED_CONTAM: hypothetical protein GTU68_057150 [Idotea baltica]|nr:hypothetical protein [Idotea baltica]